MLSMDEVFLPSLKQQNLQLPRAIPYKGSQECTVQA